MKNNGVELVSGSLTALILPRKTDLATTQPNQLAIDNNTMLLRNNNNNFNTVANLNVSLFDFSSHEFVSPLTSFSGPSRAQVIAQYTTEAWASDLNFFNVVEGIQIWTVPDDGIYQIAVSGATRPNVSAFSYSRVPELVGRFTLAKNDKLYILVGQRGTYSGSSSTTGYAAGGRWRHICLQKRHINHTYGWRG